MAVAKGGGPGGLGGGNIIEAVGLVKRYADVVALDGLDLTVEPGTLVALLGPNGAGKTTAMRVFTTLVQPDAGRASVVGLDVVADAGKVRARIGVSGQYAAVDEYLTGYENLVMVGRLYHLGAKRSRARARELLERFELTEAANRLVKGYSGGMRRRLDLAGALVAAPSVLFLDEPTAGLDPKARIMLWDAIDELVADGSTLLLTTQYMEEADRLASRLTVIDRGRVIATGTPDELKRQIGGDRLELVVSRVAELDVARSTLGRLAIGEIQVDADARKMVAPVRDGSAALIDGLGLLASASVRVLDVGLRRPTLDDVLLALTGRPDANGARMADRREEMVP